MAERKEKGGSRVFMLGSRPQGNDGILYSFSLGCPV